MARFFFKTYKSYFIPKYQASFLYKLFFRTLNQPLNTIKLQENIRKNISLMKIEHFLQTFKDDLTNLTRQFDFINLAKINYINRKKNNSQEKRTFCLLNL